MKNFTNDEKAIARNIDKEYKWIARDRDGELCIYDGKPEKGMDSWYFDGYDRLSYYAEENMADCTLFGHTHVPFAGYVGGALLVNPGALKNGSMCLLEVDEKDIVPRIMDIDQWIETQG